MRLIIVLPIIFLMSVDGFFYGSDKFFNVYLRYRFTFNCLGYANMKEETLKLFDAYVECMHGNEQTNTTVSEETTNTSEEKEEEDAQPEDMKELPKTFSYFIAKNRNKDVLYPESLVRFITSHVVTRVEYHTCANRKLNNIDEDENLAFGSIVERVRDYKLNPLLEKDILAGLDYCHALSLISVNSSLPTAHSENQKKWMSFMLCKDQQITMACFKQDMRYSKQEYELAGLDGAFEKLSDEEKVMEIVWANLMMNGLAKPEEFLF